jgi:hypothetical protein
MHLAEIGPVLTARSKNSIKLEPTSLPSVTNGLNEGQPSGEVSER